MGQTQSFISYQDQLLKQTKKRCYEVPNSAEKGTTSIYRCFGAENGFGGFMKVQEEKGEVELDTALKLFSLTVKKYGNNDFCGFRPFLDKDDPSKRGDYQWMTYKTFWEEYSLPWGNGLQTLGLPEKTNIGIFSMNRPEWYALHIGNLTQSFRTVALYDTLGPTAVAYITSHAECELVVCEKNKLSKLFDAIRDCKAGKDDEKNDNNEVYKGFAVKYIVQLDVDKRFANEHETVDDADRATAKELGCELLGLSEVLAKGKGKTDMVEPTKDDLAYIMYTSGTTGNPKGVLLTHGCFAATVASGQRKFQCVPEDVYISYLPLAHIYEASGQALMTFSGAKVAYFQGDLRKILDDWKAIRPTMLVGVPRVYAKTYDKFEAKKSKMTGVKSWLVESASESSKKAIRQNGKRSSFYDKVVWSKVPVEMGFDKVRILVSAAAPLPPHVAEFLRIAIPQARVFQGYGMTETCASGTITDADDFTLGHVGVPIDNAEVRLVDAPECNYMTTDEPHPRGEIQIRGLALMQGYFKNEAATKKTLSEDGWLSTGDIGRINPNNTISIIDRRKNLFKLSSGEYIASEKVEAQYTKVASIGQCFVYANSNKSFIVGIIVPEASNLMDFFHEKGWINDEEASLAPATDAFSAKFNEVCKAHKDDVKAKIKADCDEWVKGGESGLLKYELLRDFDVECEIDTMMQGFNVANNCMTPTFKKKRPQLTRRYIETIKQMYTDNGEPPKDTENW